MYEGVVQDLIDELGRLPGVGPKSAQRIAFHLLAADPADVRRLAQTLIEVKDKVRFCTICGKSGRMVQIYMLVKASPAGTRQLASGNYASPMTSHTSTLTSVAGASGISRK